MFFIFIMLMLLMNLYYYMNISLNLVMPYMFFYTMDMPSILMMILLPLVMIISYILFLKENKNFSSLSLFFIMVLLTFSVMMTFICSHSLLFFIFYEFSLIPIMFIILNWGHYSGRSLSVIMMIFYTILFGSPFLLILMMINFFTKTFFFYMYMYMEFSMNFMEFIIFMSFAVKLPVYGIHYWLPLAHVEAPTFGSVILASLLLKLGGLGLIRFSLFMNFFLKKIIISFLMFSMVYVTLICCFQSDFKRLIAYSSISHMIFMPIMIMNYSIFSVIPCSLLMFYHGISSSLMFITVGMVYSVYNTRSLLLIRGIFLLNLLSSMFLVLTFFLSVSIPPFPTFIMEIFIFMNILNISIFMSIFIFVYLFMSLIYNLNWLSSILMSSSNNSITFNFSFINFICLNYFLIFTLMSFFFNKLM